MNRSRGVGGASAGTIAARAFTLAELMVAMTIVAVLIALLLPSLGGAWGVAQQTQCKTNLNRIWQASSSWRADNDGRIMDGGSWMGRVYAYVDYDRSVFQCKARAQLMGLADAPDPVVTDAHGNPITDENGSYPPSGANSDDPVDSSFEFDVYFQVGTSGDTMGGTHVKGAFAWSIPLDGHPWVRRTDMGDKVKYEVDDEGSTGGAGRPITYDDLWFYIYYNDDGQPTKLEIIKGACTSSPYVKFIIEFKINGETVIDNWVDHIGQSLEFDVDEKTGNEAVSNAGQVWVTDAEGNTRQIYALILGDYAINRGSYEGAGGRILTGVDPSLFYILDYGYKRSVADYNKVGDEDEWDKFFITDPVRWERSFGGEGRNWREHQALRHFGTANVLFCDGHIESLGPEDLEYTNPRWTYRGR